MDGIWNGPVEGCIGAEGIHRGQRVAGGSLSGGGVSVGGGFLSRGSLSSGVSVRETSPPPTSTVTWGGTHPTGMHSCIGYVYLYLPIHFLVDHHCKSKSELTDMLKSGPNLLNFLQG